MQRVYEENEWGKVSKRIVTILVSLTEFVFRGFLQFFNDLNLRVVVVTFSSFYVYYQWTIFVINDILCFILIFLIFSRSGILFYFCYLCR